MHGPRPDCGGDRTRHVLDASTPARDGGLGDAQQPGDPATGLKAELDPDEGAWAYAYLASGGNGPVTNTDPQGDSSTRAAAP